MNNQEENPSFARSSPASGWTWDQMLERFRALGGTADNIVQRDGPLGRGIFPLDRKKFVLLHVPPNLLVPDDDVAFEDDSIKIKASSQINQPERDFFEKYQNGFSWGGSGRSDAAAFLALLDALPSNVKESLSDNLGYKKLLHGSGRDRIRQRFLDTRHVEWKGRMVCMPLVELLNHGPEALPYHIGDNGISVKGRFAGEVLARYGWDDPIGIFFGWGFASPELQAFSRPVKLDLGQRRLVVGRDVWVSVRRGDFKFPTLTATGNDIALSYLMIGHVRHPKLSKAIFYTLMKENGVKDAEALFDRILHFNRTKLLELLAALEPHRGGMIHALRTMIRYQLEAMSHCVGTQHI